MLTRLRLRNFKAWKDTGDVRLAPITVLFGVNSAGKTSIPQALLLMRQTAQSGDRRRALHFGDERTPVDLGDLRSVMFRHDMRRSLEMDVDWTLPAALEVHDAYHGGVSTASALGLRVVTRGEGEPPQPMLQRMMYELDPGSADPMRIGMVRGDDGTWSLDAHGYRPVRRTGRKWALPAPTHFYGFPDEAVAYYQNTSFVADLGLEATRVLRGVYYLGPLREHPRRLYSWSGETPSHVGERGESAVDALLAAGGRRYNFAPKQHLAPLDVLVAGWLTRMGLIDDFTVAPVARGRREHEVRVRTGPDGAQVLLTDVGFGVSQVLPVVVECFYVPPGATVILEQPELHLHPAAQAGLADLFIDAIRAREGGRPRGVQLLVESHSEHLLRRLQRRVAEGALKPEEVAVYFVRPGADGAELEELPLDAYGRIARWPEGFFGDALGDTEAQMRAMLERMMAERGLVG